MPPMREDVETMKVEHGDWTIDSRPQQMGHHWHSWCEIERRPTDDGVDGEIFHFFDIGYFDTQRAAYERAVSWAKAWIEDNF
ncbi:hypothetical protein AWB82_01740 [Caballeronia glebae]|uniref:Uncharacterized protein n=2 Tax=Caballeronia glebae TaxID=1777143 RepID=A0A158A5G4_9BURK|nr:hypothetical protein AWB82_01740 [Caballeronia glebae]